MDTSSQENAKILFVDDEPNVLRALERVFLDDDYEIFTAASGPEGLESIRKDGPFPVIVSDYRMPGMTGVEFLREAYKIHPESMRIVLSGYADTSAIVDAINEGHIYKFIPKPWNDDELRITVGNCLERFQLQQKNRMLMSELEASNRQLEEKVQQRTEQLELRNRALEFSQKLLGNLPVAVMAIDENGMLVFCNTKAVLLFKPFCQDMLGSEIGRCCDGLLGGIIDRIEPDTTLTDTITLGGQRYRVTGCKMAFFNSMSTTIVITEE